MSQTFSHEKYLFSPSSSFFWRWKKAISFCHYRNGVLKLLLSVISSCLQPHSLFLPLAVFLCPVFLELPLTRPRPAAPRPSPGPRSVMVQPRFISSLEVLSVFAEWASALGGWWWECGKKSRRTHESVSSGAAQKTQLDRNPCQSTGGRVLQLCFFFFFSTWISGAGWQA